MAAMDGNGFGAQLKRLRLAAGLTQEVLAERAGVSARAVSDLERDHRRLPRLDTARLLANALALGEEARRSLLAAARPGLEPLRPAPHASASFPRPLTPLLGRAGVIDAIVGHLCRGDLQLLCLTGPGGVGKTRLAIAAAQRAARAFAHGTVFVDLAPLRDSQLVPAAIAQHLGIDDRNTLPLPERLAAALGRQHLLLVLDNFEHLLPARDDLVALLAACPSLVVLATSRVPLQVRGEREYRIAPLELPGQDAAGEASDPAPAVALFLDRAQHAGAEIDATSANLRTIATICRRLDGLPLAIELAAAWTRLLPLDALIVRLERRLPLLVDGPHDLPARQRTMRDAIAWSYDLLGPDEQRLFRALSVFVGSFTPEAAAAVVPAGAEPGILPRLAALVDRSLLQRRPVPEGDAADPRLAMLETLREYGLERLEERGEDIESRTRHAACFLAMAETAGATSSRGRKWRSRLERDHDNLRAALDWSLAAGDATTVLRLAAALWRFWHERGYLGEGRRWLQVALSASRGEPIVDAPVRAEALIGAATLAIDQGDYNGAESWCIEAIGHARQHGLPAALVEALNTQGLLARERGNYAEAYRYHAESLALARAGGDHLAEASALTGLAYTAVFAGDISRGIPLAEESVAILRTTGDAHALAVGILGLVANLSHAGDFARVEQQGEEALRLFRELGDTGKVAETLWILAIAAQFQEDDGRAIALHGENLALRQARGDEHGTIQPLTALAAIAIKNEDHPRARSLLEETLEILDRYDDRWARAMSLMFLGHVEVAEGHLERAVAGFEAAAALMRDIGNALYLPWCLEGLAAVAAAWERWELVARMCGARDALHTSLGLGTPPANPNGWAQARSEARGVLGDETFDAARGAGGVLTVRKAIAEIRSMLRETPAP